MQTKFIPLICLLFSLEVQAQFSLAQVIEPTHSDKENFKYQDYVDLNGDGIKDLVLTNALLYGLEDGSFEQPQFFDSSYNYFEIFSIDIDQDGDLDLLPRFVDSPFSSDLQSLLILRNDGEGDFELQQLLQTPTGTLLGVGDVEGDGDLDLLANQFNRLYWYINDAGYSEENKRQVGENFFYGDAASVPLIADINGDNLLDVLMLTTYWQDSGYGSGCSQNLLVALVQEENLGFSSSELFNECRDCNQVNCDADIPGTPAAGDFNDDGHLDIVFSVDGYWFQLYGQEDGSFVKGDDTFYNSSACKTLKRPGSDLLVCSSNVFDLSQSDDALEHALLSGTKFSVDDAMGIGSDQIITRNSMCRMDILQTLPDDDWELHPLYETYNCWYSDIDLIDHNHDDKLDIFLANLESMQPLYNESGLPMQYSGNIHYAGSGMRMHIVDQEHLCLIDENHNNTPVLIRYNTDNTGQYISEDTLTVNYPDLGYLEIQRVTQNFFGQGDLNVIIEKEQMLTIKSVTGDTSNVTSAELGGSITFLSRLELFDDGKDGDLDLFCITGSGTQTKLLMLENQGGTLSEPVELGTEFPILGMCPIHINDDAKTDFLLIYDGASFFSTQLFTVIQGEEGELLLSQVLESQANGIFGQKMSDLKATVFDGDLDGDQDIALSFARESGVEDEARYYKNNGDETFTSYELPVDESQLIFFRAGNLFGDEQPELVQLCTFPSWRIRIYTNDNSLPELPLESTTQISATGTILYPNPVQDQLTLENLCNAERLLLYDFTGRLLLEQALPQHSERESLDLSALPNGTYFLQIYTKDVQHRSVKFVKT